MWKSKRLYFNLVMFGLFVTVPVLPWYLVCIVGIMGVWYVPEFYEFIALGFLIDVSYGSIYFFKAVGHPFPLPFTILSAVCFAILQVIKNKVRFYS